MRTVQSTLASPALRPYVRAFAQRTGAELFESQPVPAFLETVIHFDFGDLLSVRTAGGQHEGGRRLGLVGPHTHAGTHLQLKGSIDTFAIFLQPSALWSFFRVPISVIMETHYDAEEVLGAPLGRLWCLLSEAPNFTTRVQTAETFLLRSNFAAPETVATAAASVLSRLGGRISIRELASQLNISVRQLERDFIRELGIPPIRFARVARFQTALDARIRQPDKSWLSIALESGYHDQMHLVHEFHSLNGSPPTLTMEQLGDSRPSALASYYDGVRLQD